MTGDFNCVGSDLDVTPNALGSRRTGFSNGLHVVQQTFGLTDVWRERHPAQRAITHVCASSFTGARLDRWLVSSDILFRTTHCDMVDELPGDHVGVSLRFSSPREGQQGPRPWKFPVQLADDEQYCQELAALIRDYPCEFQPDWPSAALGCLCKVYASFINVEASPVKRVIYVKGLDAW